jgi:hypothetical protein
MRSPFAIPALALLLLVAPAAAEPTAEAPPPPAGASRVALGLPNPLRASRFDVELAYTPGVPTQGEDLTSAHLGFALQPRWAFVDTETDWAWVGARIGWGLELLDDDTTTSPRRVRFDDLELQLAYSRTVARTERGLSLLIGPRVAVAFPTSPESRGGGVYTHTSLGAGVDLHLPLLRGPWLSGALFSISGAWQHAFGKLPANSILGAPVVYETPAGPMPMGIGLLDQGRFFGGGDLPGRGQGSLVAAAWIHLFHDLSLGTAWGFAQGEPLTYGGCVLIGSSSSCTDTKTTFPSPTTIFDVGLGYAIADLVWIAAGYDNTHAVLPNPSSSNGFFHSADARLYFQVSLLGDGIFAAATRPAPPAPPPR